MLLPRTNYAFGHLVSGYSSPDDPYSDASIGLGYDTLEEMGYSQEIIEVLDAIAQEVAANYKYTGELDAHRTHS